MIRFGLRLAVAGGREAAIRLIVIAAAVALGVGLLLATLAGVNGVSAMWARGGWTHPQPAVAGQAQAADPAWWAMRMDMFHGKPVDRYDVAGTGPRLLTMPGVPKLPGPGEYYASPALSKLLAETPAEQLADRVPGRQIGTIGDVALQSPDSLVLLVGGTPDEVSKVVGAMQISSLETDAPAIPVAALDLILSVVAAGLLFPVLIFIATATRLSAARREQRFAAMRLIGATPRQISVIAAVESTVAAIAGTAAGFALFFLVFRDAISRFPFTGQRFHPADLSLGWLVVLLVALGVPAGAAVAARFALRRVRISPLGVTRRVTPKPPSPYRLVPLALGIAELVFFIGRVPDSSNAQVAVFMPGILLMMVGLLLGGPWLTMVGARILARRARRPSTLIAARRLADNPQAAFRAVSGVVLALFVTSVAIGVIGTIVANRGVNGNALTASTLSMWMETERTELPDSLTADLRAVPGVHTVTAPRANPVNTKESLSSVISCAELAKAHDYGRCADGATVAEIWSDLVGRHSDLPTQGSDTVWPTSSVTLEQLGKLPIDAVVVGTDGSPAALERARTVLELANPEFRIAPASEDDFNGDFRTQLNGYRQLANVVILFSLPIAGCSLAVSVAAGISDRKRPFSLLRLTGVPLQMLRQVVALESAVPLLAVAVIAIVTGLVAAQLFLRAQMHYTLTPPGTSYYTIVVLGLLASLAIIASTLPLLERITGPETARNE
jgi:hypothetical protein